LERAGGVPGVKQGIVMAKLRRLALAGIAAASWGSAKAADLPPVPSLPSEPPEAAEFSGWYLRGDVGGGVEAASPQLDITPGPLAGPIAIPTPLHSSLSPFGMVDIGAGYQPMSWFRADATIGYRGSANLRSSASGYPWLGPAQNGDVFHANLASFVGLVNGYVVPGAWYGFSPFLGASVGFADNRLSSVSAAGPGQGGRFISGSRTSFAWAAMAGVDYGLTANLKLELSYRYLSYGTVTTGSPDGYTGLAGPISSRNRLTSNDFRLGLIYFIGEAQAPLTVAR
jgi:opacity protein-like surface antigen